MFMLSVRRRLARVVGSEVFEIVVDGDRDIVGGATHDERGGVLRNSGNHGPREIFCGKWPGFARFRRNQPRCLVSPFNCLLF